MNRHSLEWRLGSRLALVLIVVTVAGVAGLVWHTASIEASHGHHGLVHDVIREFFLDLAWGIPVLIGLIILSGGFIVRRAMAPLRAVAEAAQTIGPAVPEARLPRAGVPSEILPVVDATNAALERLQHAYQLQQRFIANAAHELRTPIATFRAALDRLPDSDGKAGLIGDVERLSRLTAQLLDLARAERADTGEVTDAADVAHGIALDLAPVAAARGVVIDVALADALVARGSREHIHAIIRNLMENAINHAPAGSAVHVVQEGHSLAIEDAGPGVPAELRERIFERFVRGSWTTTTGGGLGLAIAREAANRIGAAISVEAPATVGARFVVRFAA
jgi:signal transduction histidine kinase